MQGHFTVARRFFFPLLLQGIREGSWAKIDTAIYALNVYNTFVGSIVTVLLWGDLVLTGGTSFTSLYTVAPLVFNILTVAIYAQFPLAMIMEKAPLKSYKGLITYIVFLLSWWPITFYAFFTQNNKQWSHTEHTRVIRLDEVQSKQVS